MILGLDMATKKTGYGLLDENANLYSYGVIRTTSDEPRERIKEVYNAIENIIKNNTITHMVFEDVPVTSHNNLKTGKDLCILQGVILSLCFKYQIGYTFYAPSSWRSLIGTYDGTKAGMKRDVQKQKAVDKINEIYNLGFIYNKTETKSKQTDDDKAEAICLALAYIENMCRSK
jgi:lactococcus phage M3 protein|nr:MAG TPA: RuvC [Caudoviricetes sp.]